MYKPILERYIGYIHETYRASILFFAWINSILLNNHLKKRNESSSKVMVHDNTSKIFFLHGIYFPRWGRNPVAYNSFEIFHSTLVQYGIIYSTVHRRIYVLHISKYNNYTFTVTQFLVKYNQIIPDHIQSFQR